ncbi:MAG: discoidin domain-containing protein [Marinagarivorans sp.]|nr:discoidin domain-containing protein [Marinagarivorans sp.]
MSSSSHNASSEAPSSASFVASSLSSVASSLNSVTSSLSSSSSISRSSSAISNLASSSQQSLSSSSTANLCTGVTQNIAIGRPVKASSLDKNLIVVAAEDAVDGDANTRWASDYLDDQWLSVDFGNTAHLCEVQLHWEAAYASRYNVQISDDGEQWQTLVSQADLDGGQDTLRLPANTQARYLRIQSVTRATEWGISLWELAVFGNYQGSPVAQFTASPNTPILGAKTTLDASASFDQDGEIIAYDWSEQGSSWTATGKTATYTANRLGTHSLQLTITDADGNQASATQTLTVAGGNPICQRAYFCEGFENGFGAAVKVGDKGNIDTTQGANGSKAAYHYNTFKGGGNAWVEFTNKAINSAPEVWVSYYQKIIKTPVPTNWFALIGRADSDFPAFRLGSQQYADINGVLGNWSCWNGSPCPAGMPAGYDKSIDSQGGRRPLPNNKWVCIEIHIKKGPIVSVHLTPSVRADIPDGGAYIKDSAAPGQFPIERVKLGYNPQSDSLEGWVDDVIIAAERPGCQR